MQEVPFADFGLKWFEDIVNQTIQWFAQEILTGYEAFESGFFSTPLPEGEGTALVFSPPPSSDEPWRAIYDSTVGGEVMVLALFFLMLCVQGRHFIRIFNVSSAYEERRTKRNAWVGAVLIVAWYFLAVLVLYFVEGLTVALVPDLGTLGAALIDILPKAAGSPMITLCLAAIGGLSMVALKAVYFLRELLLYVYLYGMPFGIAAAYANIPVVSRIAKQLCKQFIPLAILPIPAAVLFRGYTLLFTGDPVVTPDSAFLEYLVVVSLPLLALVVTWRTFTYASPLTAQVIGTTTKAAVTLGAIAGAGYVGGPYAASTAARWGPRAAAGQVAAQRAFSSGPNGQSTATAGTSQDNVAADNDPSYRRTENDPQTPR